MAVITRINPAEIAQPVTNYAQVVTAEGAKKLVFCAGQTAVDPAGKIMPAGDFAAQAALTMQNLEKALAAAGARVADITKITMYICDRKHVMPARDFLDKYFAGQPPASTLCILAGLAQPDYMIEVDAIAAI